MPPTACDFTPRWQHPSHEPFSVSAQLEMAQWLCGVEVTISHQDQCYKAGYVVNSVYVQWLK